MRNYAESESTLLVPKDDHLAKSGAKSLYAIKIIERSQLRNLEDKGLYLETEIWFSRLSMGTTNICGIEKHLLFKPPECRSSFLVTARLNASNCLRTIQDSPRVEEGWVAVADTR